MSKRKRVIVLALLGAILLVMCWFLTEIVGEIYNIQIGTISAVMFNIVWVFYGTCIVCIALRGYNWGSG